jgi:Nuclease-related domain.
MGQSRHLTLRRPDHCAVCNDTLEVGEVAWWDADRRVVECGACHPELSTAGASAQREGQRRYANRDRRTREQHRFTGGLRMAMAEAPSHETSWKTGAEGEHRVGGMLDKLAAGGSIRVVHDRRIPGSSANIDHIAVAPSGVYVIDTKRHQNKLVEDRIRRGPAALHVGGSSKPQMVEQMQRQVDAVRKAFDVEVRVVPVLCFIDANWRLFNKSFQVDGVYVCHPIVLRKWVGRNGPLTIDGVEDLNRRLLRRLRAA